MSSSGSRPPVPPAAWGPAAGVGAYLLWGLLTVYWPLLEPAVPLEILAHRVVWALLTLAALLAVLRRGAWLVFLRRHPRQLALVVAASVLITVNWYTYIWSVNNGHVVEAALGYFITPLFNALLGVLVLRERLGRGHWAGIGLAAAGVGWLMVVAGRPPWVSLVIATSWSLYGLIKKRVRLGALESLTAETACLFVPAAAILAVMAADGTGTLAALDAGHDLLLASAGVVTILPLVLFGVAARRIPLAMLGMLQYLTPTIQFILGVLVFSEPVAAAELAGYVLVWSGLLAFVAADVTAWRRARTRTRASAAEV